jgi:hypothetical protein
LLDFGSQELSKKKRRNSIDAVIGYGTRFAFLGGNDFETEPGGPNEQETETQNRPSFRHDSGIVAVQVRHQAGADYGDCGRRPVSHAVLDQET